METGVDDADYQAEARLVAGMVGQSGLLGQVASCRPEEDAGFEAWLDECEGLQVHGFRRILHVMPDELSQTPTFRRNLARIGARGLGLRHLRSGPATADCCLIWQGPARTSPLSSTIAASPT